MADTDTETLPNGTGALSEEDERLKQRPADIDADVREMERRKRVEALMSSKLFREELERVLDQQLHEGGDAPLLQRIREMVGGRLHTGSLRGPSCVLPINDIRGIEGVGYEKGEKILRCKLAAVYRLVDLFGWTQTGMSGQITARLNTAVEQVLTTPRGLLPHEVTASSLVKVDMQGNVQDQGTTNFPPNVEGFSIHGAVHAARPDVRCVLHVRSSSALAVSCMKRGLLPLCDEACVLGEVAYHPLPYGKLDNEEQEKLVRALGPHAKVLILYSNGALCCGATLEEAFFQAKNLTAACDVQLRLASLPLPELQLIDEDTKKHIYEASRKPPADEKKWRVGGEEFEALMRMLDNAGFRTGYIYRHPLIKNEVPKPRNDVEVPPAVSSLGYLFEEEELYRQGLWKKGTGTRGERTRWLNSPNVYQKVEVLETGTNDPRKITKWVDANNDEWVQDGSPGHSSTPVKIDTLQFVPKNTNPKEFKALQQQIKDNRRADKISAGPQSHILEGVTWDEAAKLVGEDAHNTHTGDAVVLMGAASKGIIQRGYQHNATVYSAPYARNPFDHISDREIQEYRRIVERKQRPDYDTDVSESEAISAAQLTSPASEDESRDEHRVLRIETKQVPVRSQPEVVLSDVDTTDFLHAERAHADRTKDYQRDPNLLSDDEVFFDTPVSPLTSSVASPEPEIKFLEKSKRSQPIVVVRTQTRNDVVLRTDVVKTNITPTQQRVLTGTLTSDRGTLTEALNSNKRTLHDFPRNTNLQNAIKKFDEIPTHSLKHPKCKISLNSKLPSDLRIELKEKLSDLNSLGGAKMTNAFDLTSKMTDVRSDALDVYNGNASSRSSLNSIPSIEWDARCRWEHNLRTRSLPRKLKNTTNRFYRTQSHCGFVNFNKEPEPVHFHLPRCRSCGTTNSSYAWELTKEEKGRHASSSLYCSGDNLHQKFIDEAKHTGTIVKVTEKVVPVFKVAKPDDSDSEFVESQEFTEDNYIGDIGNSFSSANQTVVEKDQSNSQDLTMTQARVQDNAKGGKIEGSSATDSSNSDTFRAELVNITAGIEDINNNVDNAAAGEYHSFTEEMDFEEAVYESPVKDLVEKDIRDYSVPIDFYYADYKNRSSGMSPAKRVDPKPGTLEPILEESKSSYDDSGNLSNDKSNLKDDLEQSSKDMAIEEHEDKRVLLVQELKKNSEDMKQKVEDKMVSDDFGILYPQKSIENNIDTLLISENCIAKKEVNHYSNESIEAEHLIDKSSYIINGEDESEYTTNDLSSVTNAVQTAMEIYTTLDEEIEVDTADIAECVYENIFEMLSIDAIATEVRSSSVEYSVASSSELKSFNSTVEFEKHEVIAEIVTEMLNKICASNDNRKVFVDLPKPKIGSHSDMYEAGFVTAVEVSVKETELTKNNTSLDSGSDNTNNNNVELIYEGKAVINELSESKCGLIEQCSLNFTSYSSTKDSSVQLTSENSSVTDSSGELMSDTASHASPEEFSLAKIIEDIELNFTGKLSETSLAESSDSEISHTYKIVEGLLYYIFNEAFAVSNKRSRSEKTKVVKSVVTVVDPEDILFTTSAAILNDNIFIEADANQCIVLEDVVAEDQDELTNNKHDIKECKSNTNKSVINRKIDNVATISESKYDKTPIYSQIKRDTPELKIDSRLTLLEESAQLNGNNKPETNSVCKGISGLQKQSEVTHNESELKVEIKSISQAFGEFVVLDDNQNTGSETISDEQKKSEKAYEFRKSCIDAEHKIISEENMCPEFNTSKNSFANVKDRKSHLSSVVTENLNHVEAVEMCSDNVFVMRLDNYVTLNTDENIAKHDNPSLRELINEDHEITTNVKNTQELQTCKSDDYQQYLNDKIVPLADTDKNHKPISNADISYRMHEECLETTVFNMEDIVNMSNNEQTLALSQEIRNYGNVYAEQEYLEDKALTNKETYNLEQISNKIGVEAQKDFVHDADVSVLPEASFLASDDFNIGRQSVDNLSDADNSLTPDLSVLGVEAQIESVYNKRIQLDISILPETSSFESTMGSDDFNAATQSVDAISGADNSVTPNISVLNNSEMSTDTVKTDATYVIKKDMNTAFLEASSPKRETPVFEACSESPIKNTSGNFAEDVSLYGKDDTILGSPFVKQTVISMSQSAHSGGIKYWLSFDENLTDEAQQKSFKSVRRSKGSEFPSFVTLDCHNKRNKRQEFVLTNDYERKPERRSSVLDLQQSEDRTFLMAGSNQLEQSDFNLKDDIYVNKRRGGVLFDDSDQSKESDLKIEDSFASCTSTDYVTCESDQKVKQEFQNPDVPKKKLIYDTRVDLHTKPGRRYASWPPFEDTLFYRIISQFRMSESFDPSDFENLTFDDSAL